MKEAICFLIDHIDGEQITVEVTQFDKNYIPTSWAIRRQSSRIAFSKKHKLFVYEPFPSNRTKAFLKDTRFDTHDNASDFWQKNKAKYLKLKDIHEVKRGKTNA